MDEVAERFVCNNPRCRFTWETPDGDCQSGQVCEVCKAGKMRRDRPMPWDEPERLAFYGVDPGAYGNRERAARASA